MSSSLALAKRTAQAAAARMDTVNRQMATGKEVASAKDDGARFAQAAALKSRQAEIEGRATLISFVRTSVDQQALEDSSMRESMNWIRDILVRSLQHAPGTTSREVLHREFQQALNSVTALPDPSAPITSGYGSQADGRWGIASSSADPVFGGRTIWSTLGATAYTSWLNLNGLNALDLRTATTAQVQGQITGAVDVILNDHQWLPMYENRGGQEQRWLDAVSARDAATNDRLDQAIGSLTDADLGKLAAERQQTQTRQQLALSTIQQAISAYGNFASGLFGNVQRTQRGLLA